MSFINQPRQVWWRKVLFQVHLWAGIGAGIYVLLVSVTGAALVFRPELDPHLDVGKRPVNSRRLMTLEEVRQSINRHTAPGEVQWILYHEKHPEMTREVWVKTPGTTEVTKLSVDPKDGRLYDWTPLRFLRELHVTLLGGAVGERVNGIGAICLIVLSLTGLVVWWPGIRNWRRALRIAWDARWVRLNWDLHSVIGFWTVAFVLMWAVTGVRYPFPQPFRAVVGAFLPGNPPRDEITPVANSGSKMTLDELVSVASDLTPGFETTWVGILKSKAGREYISISRQPPGAVVADAADATVILLDPSNGNTLRVENPDDRTTADSVFYWFNRFHFGDFGGWPVKILWTILGLAPAFLFVTGALMWWNRVLSKKWAKLRDQQNRQHRSLRGEVPASRES